MSSQTLTNSSVFSKLPMAELSLLLTAFFWGTSYGITKDALVYTGVLAFIVIRFGVTSILLAPIFIKELRSGLAKDWQFALPTGGILLCIFLAETYGVLHTSASKAAFLISLCVLMTPFVEAITERRLPSVNIVLFALLSLFGVFLLTTPNTSQEALSFHSFDVLSLELNKGDCFILLAAFLRACMVVATKTLLKGKNLSALSTTSIQANVVTLGALLIFVSEDYPIEQLFPAHLDFWLAAFYLALCCTFFALFAQNFGVRHTSPSRVALLTGSEPAFGALFAYYWLGESLGGIQMLGAICILAATIMATIRK
ncbi:EamA-like transporter family protein [Marinomonas spartinae]|uniref:EamA-like transporter family protein n=1 Tax=Marinomonas spartinae TaxID=1792290 RepID=A0A1A8TCK4_9GAMM|nr:DMT family transporter [Marinomonas spartinae]SBS30791.1 EamA-like transporter family protein [Marinomonas spartinae]